MYVVCLPCSCHVAELSRFSQVDRYSYLIACCRTCFESAADVPRVLVLSLPRGRHYYALYAADTHFYWELNTYTLRNAPQVNQLSTVVLSFLQRVRIACNAGTAVLLTSVSVRLSSVTFRCFVETNEDTIMRFSLSGSTIILVRTVIAIITTRSRCYAVSANVLTYLLTYLAL